MRIEGEKRYYLDISDRLVQEIYGILVDNEVINEMRLRAMEERRSVDWTDVAMAIGNRFYELETSEHAVLPSIEGLISEFNQKRRDVFGFIQNTLKKSNSTNGRDDYERLEKFTARFAKSR